jgi:putative ubiquitin-RnfH superfamily antitoxin RatB of RatAB toxin-antitoxin module
MLNIEIIYALIHEQKIFKLSVKAGTTLEKAILQSGIMELYPEIDLTKNTVGVFSQRQSLSYELKDGDRIEIYRDLIADPKEVRRNRAQIQRNEGVIK